MLWKSCPSEIHCSFGGFSKIGSVQNCPSELCEKWMNDSTRKQHDKKKKEEEEPAAVASKESDVPAVTLERVLRENPGISIPDAFQKLNMLRAQADAKASGVSVVPGVGVEGVVTTGTGSGTFAGIPGASAPPGVSAAMAAASAGMGTAMAAAGITTSGVGTTVGAGVVGAMGAGTLGEAGLPPGHAQVRERRVRMFSRVVVDCRCLGW